MLHQSISDQPVALGFPHRAVRYRPAETRVSSHGRWSSFMYEGVSDLGMGPYRLPFLFRAPANQSSAGRVGVSTPRGAVSNRVSVPGLSELQRYKSISEMRMEPYRPDVRWGREVLPWDNSRAEARLQPISDRASMAGVSTPHGAVSTEAYHPRLALDLFSNLTQSAIGR